MKLVDTSIFIYAEGHAHVLKGSCRALVAVIRSTPHSFNIDAELLQEVLHIHTMRGDRPAAFNTYDALTALFPTPEPITAKVMHSARRLLESCVRLSVRDAVHAAVALESGLEGLVATDGDFADVPGLRVWHPRDLI